MALTDNSDSVDDAFEQNSEFDSDASEQEMLLYTQLYFGNQIEENVVEKESDKIQEQTPPVTHISNSMISTAISKSLDSTNENDLQNQNPKRNIDKVIKEITNTKKPKRIRNPSTCSIESISGKASLDNLYCIDLSLEDPLDTVDEDLNDSQCDNEFKKLENPNSKFCSVNKITTEDDEISVLPPPSPKQVETVMLESENSNSSIKVVNCIKRKKKNILTKKKKKIAKSQVLCISSDSPSSESEDDNLDVSSVPIIFKLGSKIISTKDKNKDENVKKNTCKSSVYAKSRIIFSEDRPLTQKQPSCPTWTQEMASLYDSDYSDEFSIEDIHQMQNSHPKYWRICPEDRKAPRNKNRRYYEARCVRCKDFGHTVNQCSRVPHCRYCSATDHQNVNDCPQNCCLRCGKQPHRFCLLTTQKNVCDVCGQFGHASTLCPDLWRRFHATTAGTVPVIPDENQLTKKRIPYCYNCAKKGHYGHECRSVNRGNMQIRINYLPVSAEIFSYEPFIAKKTKETKIVAVESNTELDRSTEKQMKYLDPSVKRDEKTSNNQDKKILLQTIPLTEAQYKLLSYNKYILSEVQRTINPRVENITFGKVGHNLNLSIRGTEQAIQSAVAFISMYLNRSPLKEYNAFMKSIKMKKKLLKKKNQLKKIEKEKCIADDEPISEPSSGRTSNVNSTPVASAKVSSKIESSDDEVTIITEIACETPKTDKNFKIIKNEGNCITPKTCSAVERTLLNKNCKNTPSFVIHSNIDPDQAITDLPVSLPRFKPEALAALDQLFMRMGQTILKSYGQCALNYFERCKTNEPETGSPSGSLKYLQALARIVFIQRDDRAWWVRKLESLQKELQREHERKINVILYNQIANYYSRISNPLMSKLNFLIRFTKEVLCPKKSLKQKKANKMNRSKHKGRRYY